MTGPEHIRRDQQRRDRDRQANIVFMNTGDHAGDFYAPRDGVYARRGDGWEWVADSKLDYQQMLDAFRYGWSG